MHGMHDMGVRWMSTEQQFRHLAHCNGCSVCAGIPQSRAGGVPFATYDGGASQVLPSSGTHASKAKKVGAGKVSC